MTIKPNMITSNSNKRSVLLLSLVLFSSATLAPAQNETHNHNNASTSTSTTPQTTTTTTITNNSTQTTILPAQQVEQPHDLTNASGQILPSNMLQLSRLTDGIKTIIDLSWPLNEKTLHWPKNDGFKYNSIRDGEVENNQGKPYYVKSDGFTMAVHTGTHLDAPRHFSQNGWTVDQIPLNRLIDVPLHIIDLSAKVNVNRTYNFQKSDFIDAQTNRPLVTPKSVVLVYTGISKLYDQGPKAYFGTESKNISEMRIPGFSKEAAEYMVEMGVYGVGLDSASADSSERHGLNETMDPVAHAIFNSNNIYILENVGNKLSEAVGQDTRLRLTIAPLAITGGSGSPVRLVAVTMHDDCARFSPSNSAPGFMISPYFTIIMTTIGVIGGILTFGRRALN